jgi:hypothetical protein
MFCGVSPVRNGTITYRDPQPPSYCNEVQSNELLGVLAPSQGANDIASLGEKCRVCKTD